MSVTGFLLTISSHKFGRRNNLVKPLNRVAFKDWKHLHVAQKYKPVYKYYLDICYCYHSVARFQSCQLSQVTGEKDILYGCSRGCYLNSCSDKEAASFKSGRGFVNPSFPFKKYVVIVPFPYKRRIMRRKPKDKLSSTTALKDVWIPGLNQHRF